MYDAEYLVCLIELLQESDTDVLASMSGFGADGESGASEKNRTRTPSGFPRAVRSDTQMKAEMTSRRLSSTFPEDKQMLWVISGDS